jgi:hypothetical protein
MYLQVPSLVDFLVSPLGTRQGVHLVTVRLLSNFHLLCDAFRVLLEG